MQEHRLLLSAITLFSALGLTLLVAPASWFPAWFFPRLTGLGAIGDAILLVLPGILFRSERHRGHRAYRERGSLVRLRLIIAFAALLALSGSLGLYRLHRVGFAYDKGLHLVVPLLLTFGVSRFIYWRYDVTLRRALLVSIALVGIAMLSWEMTEFLSDRFLGTAAFGEEGGDVALDTALDLGLGFVGTAAGAVVTRYWRSEPPPGGPVSPPASLM